MSHIGLKTVISALILSLTAATASAWGQGLVQTPFASIAAGSPATTFNGTNGKACAPTPPYNDAVGDGCPATQATLTFPYGVVIDSNNNLFVGEYTSKLIRVVYSGGTALTAALVAAFPNYTFTPVPGNIYAFGGHPALTGTPLYCNGTSGTIALDTLGNGCPAGYANIQNPRSVAVDHDGNIFLNNTNTNNNGIRIIYVQGSAAAKLIMARNPAVTSPQPGFIYGLTTSSDFVTVRDIAVDSQENVYVADNGAATATAGNQIKRLPSSGAGWSTYIPGGAAAAFSANGDGGPAVTALLSGAFNVLLDANDNLYINDQANNRIRVVYNAGSTPPLYVEGANSAIVTSPIPGNIYTVAGGGTARTTGTQAGGLSLGATTSIGLDQTGNLLFTDSSSELWRVSATTGTAVILGGNGATATGYSAASVPAAGVPCNGVAGGPTMVDAYGDGCPASEVLAYKPIGHIVFDTAGNLYQVDYRNSAGPDAIVRKYTFNNQFAATTVGASATQSVAYTASTVANAAPVSSFVLAGGATKEFSDAGNSACTSSGPTATPAETCVYNVAFSPAQPGMRLGAQLLTSGTNPLLTSYLGGIGIGPQLSLDPATQSTLGTGLSPTGVAIDENGTVFIADSTVSASTTGSLFRSALGAAPALFATGFKTPGQVAIDGAGNVYVADAGNNRIALVTGAGVVSTFATSFAGLSFAKPQGVAVDAGGNVYISDTGNNRVLELSPSGGATQKNFGTLLSPRGLAVDSLGTVYVADSGNSRVVDLATSGLLSTLNASPALTTPVGVAVDAAGDVYVGDAGNKTLLVLAPGGSTFGTLLGGVNGLGDLAIDALGSVYLAGSGTGGVTRLNRVQGATFSQIRTWARPLHRISF